MLVGVPISYSSSYSRSIVRTQTAVYMSYIARALCFGRNYGRAFRKTTIVQLC